MIVIFRYLFVGHFVGLTLWPFVFLKDGSLRDDPILLNHERIHLRQQWELGIVLFYLWYLVEWLTKWIRYGDPRLAYYHISFEREAYRNESNLEYLSTRKSWNFLHYRKLLSVSKS